MRHLSTITRLSLAPTAILVSHLAVAAPESVATTRADVVSPAAAQASAPDERARLAPELAPVADGIRMLLGDALERIVDEAGHREALRSFYAARDFAPVWIDAGGMTAQFHAAVARLKAADADGLDASDYPTPGLDLAAADAETLAKAELALMASLMSYARDAQSGRVTPSRISPNIAAAPPVPDPLRVLDTLSGADDVARALDAFNPPHAGFRALKAKLAELRRASATDDQPRRGRKGRPATSPIDVILSNMERWRWLPRDLGASHVLVNIPDYTLDVVRDGQRVFHTRIVVGKTHTPSPVFSDEIENVQINPTWHVPKSIVYGRHLPALSRDPHALSRMGLVVSRARDGSITVRQPPGPRNALGRLKVNFPNPFHVYLHDTPDKHLFKRDPRAHSAGCMRVQNPDQFAAQVLAIGAPAGNYTPARLTGMYGTTERWIPLETRVPIHIVYMNAFVANDGRLVVRPDVYGYDARVRSALKGRYLVVTERSQRGSTVARSARAARSANQHSSRAREAPVHRGWYAPRRAFGFFGGWHPGY